MRAGQGAPPERATKRQDANLSTSPRANWARAGGRRSRARSPSRCARGERLPYTLALHRGGPDGENSHAHLLFSERGHDGIARIAAQRFKRHNPQAPAQGGARKSRAAKAGDWLDT